MSEFVSSKPPVRLPPPGKAPLALRRNAVIFLVLLVAVFVLRAPAFHWSQLNPDEPIILLIGRSAVQGHLPYVQVWDHKPPLIYWLAGAGQLMFGRTTQSFQILASLAITLTATSLYSIGRRMFANQPGWALVPSGIYLLSSLSNNGLSAHTEHFVTACSALAFSLLAGSNQSFRRLAIVGLIFGIAVQLKLLAAFEAAAAIGYVLMVLLHTNPPPNRWRMAIAGIGIMGVAILIPFAITVGIYTAAGELPLFLHTNFRYSAAYAAATRFSIVHMMQALGDQLLAASWLWFGAIGVAVFPRESNTADVERNLPRLIFFWFAGALVATLSTRRFYSHYFLTTYAPLSLLTALLLHRLCSRRGLARIIAAALVTLMIAEQGIRLGIQWRNVFTKPDDPALVARYLHQHLDPGQTFYLAGGSSVIYFLADVTPPTRYAFPQQITSTLWPRLPETDPDAELDRVMAQQPQFVVISLVDESAPDEKIFVTKLDARLQSNYQLDQTMYGYRIYKRSAGRAHA